LPINATSTDITATLSAMAHIGGTVNCEESGSTLRFLIPIACAMGKRTVFTGKGRLMERPLTPYFDIFDDVGIAYSVEDGRLTVDGQLPGETYSLRGDVSSQFVTGLLFGLSLLAEDSSIEITSPLESKPYVDLTLDVMQRFGIEIINENYEKFIIKGGQTYKSPQAPFFKGGVSEADGGLSIEGDFSQAAFWLVANALGSDVSCEGLNLNSLQGDKQILDILEQVGSPMRGLTVNVGDIPDLVPILAVLCCFCEGESRIVNAARLRLKESDRLAAITTELNKLGAKITELEDSLVIEGVDSLRGGEVDSWNDHRIAMALAIAATRATGAVTINGAESAVQKSYPNFFEDYRRLSQ